MDGILVIYVSSFFSQNSPDRRYVLCAKHGRTAHDSAHRAVIFAIAQLSCTVRPTVCQLQLQLMG